MSQKEALICKNMYKFYTVKPRPLMDYEDVIHRIMAIEKILEVYITDDMEDYSIIIKAKDTADETDIRKALVKVFGSNFTSHDVIAYKQH
ncbi:MAG: hypothetical protein ACP5LP_02985 [Candidatus Micrarchaeia archaeon]